MSNDVKSAPLEKPIPSVGFKNRKARRTASSDAWKDLLQQPIFVVSALYLGLILAIAAFPAPFAGLFGNGDPRACDLANSSQSPSPGHPFGMDVQGCDLWANVMYGARPSITIGLTVTIVAVVIAIVLGSLAGYVGGIVDTLFGRISDIFYGFPFIVAAIVILKMLNSRSVFTVAMVLSIFSWPFMARLMRATVLEKKNAEYVQAAKALGASNLRIMAKHILPNAVSPVIVMASLGIGGTIAGEAGLTFLGVGLQAPTISWGLQLNTAQSYFLDYPHLLIFPALVLSLTVLSFTLIGDAVQDALDPKRR